MQKLSMKILLLILSSTIVMAFPANYPGYYSGLSYEEPYEAKNMNLEQALARLKQAWININGLEENSKRGLDLGLGRGFSGSQAAKHLMGLAAANFAGGPGRKRHINNNNNGDQEMRPLTNFVNQ